MYLHHYTEKLHFGGAASHVLFLCGVTGNAVCEVDVASENELQCVLQSEKQTFLVTNQGFDYSRSTFLC